ncbi:hypothetical protein PR048_018962 [Dryococelus australis]|uniref:Endonuclease/exonuclease/phosphatase domain-containing protein n=1 Tax=Dryococelus australis TaxID=614101 RepID=A0ABQ9H252_9NEOP|nr:hypothetical protein PR048_018962 [Dryococelus australis]
MQEKHSTTRRHKRAETARSSQTRLTLYASRQAGATVLGGGGGCSQAGRRVLLEVEDAAGRQAGGWVLPEVEGAARQAGGCYCTWWRWRVQPGRQAGATGGGGCSAAGRQADRRVLLEVEDAAGRRVLLEVEDAAGRRVLLEVEDAAGRRVGGCYRRWRVQRGRQAGATVLGGGCSAALYLPTEHSPLIDRRVSRHLAWASIAGPWLCNTRQSHALNTPQKPHTFLALSYLTTFSAIPNSNSALAGPHYTFRNRAGTIHALNLNRFGKPGIEPASSRMRVMRVEPGTELLASLHTKLYQGVLPATTQFAAAVKQLSPREATRWWRSLRPAKRDYLSAPTDVINPAGQPAAQPLSHRQRQLSSGPPHFGTLPRQHCSCTINYAGLVTNHRPYTLLPTTQRPWSHDSLPRIVCKHADMVAKKVEMRNLELFVQERVKSLLCCQDTIGMIVNAVVSAVTRELKETFSFDVEMTTHNLRFFGIPERENENADALVLGIIHKKKKKKSIYCISHRVGVKKTDKHRPLTVKSVSYCRRAEVFRAKRLLAKSGVTIREDLTVDGKIAVKPGTLRMYVNTAEELRVVQRRISLLASAVGSQAICNIPHFEIFDNCPPLPMTTHATSISTSQLLKRRIVQFPKALHVTHVNNQSLATFTNCGKFFVIWDFTLYKSQRHSAVVHLQGYNTFRNDRTLKRGDGVAIYIRDHLTATKLLTQPSACSASSEYMFSSVLINDNVLHGTPGVGKLGYYRIGISDCIPDYEHVILMGDFNVDLLKETNKSKYLKQIFLLYNLDTTIKSHYSPQVNKFIPKIYTYRNFKDIDVNVLLTDDTETKWLEIFTLQNSDDKQNLFNDKLIGLYDKKHPCSKEMYNPSTCPLDETRYTNLYATS